MTLQTLQKHDSYDGTPSTTEIIKSMMKKNTGRHMLDSGSAYGRNFEENQKIEDLEDVPHATHDFGMYGDDIEILTYVSTYHFLKHRVDYDKQAHQLTKQFYEYANSPELEDENWLSCMKACFGGCSVNTYNQESNVDQVLQFVTFDLEYVGYADERDPRPEDREFKIGDRIVRAVEEIHGEFVALQIHNGCDVRGGYTAPVVFEAPHNADYLMMSPPTDVSCPTCGWVASQYDGGVSKDGAWDELEYHEDHDMLVHDECGHRCEVHTATSI